ncbi:MAG: endonuclease/exonuclease/phosphatase family protein [Alphaproteobacteria bacterium]|jgi:endonuclease/exonuclease/phosphatase family metal-dependent hydrolase|nr:endonuclease/exonuclease/phosphatase family protein [Alphaproteobacteria bacterium]
MLKKFKNLLLILGFFFIMPSISLALEVLSPNSGTVSNKVYTKKSAPTLRVGTYNIAAARVSDINTIAETIKDMNLEILAINEIDINTARSQNTDQLEVLKEKTGMPYGVFGKAIDFDGGEYGVAILSKYPIVNNETIKLPSADREQRVLLVAEIKIPNFDSNIVFMTTHLDWYENPELRLNQVYAINAYSIESTPSKIKDLTNKIKILAGDFNDVIETNSITTINELQRYYTHLTKEGLDTRTWTSTNPSLDLDHIFAFKGQKWVVSNATIPSKTKQNKDMSTISDHLPIILDLTLLEQ